MKRLLSIMLVLMLVLSMTATAFAEEPAKDKVTEPEAWLTKTYNDPVGYAATFSFTYTRPANEGKSGPLLTIPSISYRYDDTTTAYGGTQAVKLNFDLNSGVVPNTYHYIITENPTGAIDLEHEKLIMSQAEYEVAVKVEKLDDGTLAITEIFVTQNSNPDNPDSDGKKVDYTDPGNGNANGFNFVNTYAKEAGSDGDSGSLVISKTVQGGLDATQDFQFKFSYIAPAGGNPFTPAIAHSNDTPHNLNVGKETQFTLKNGESITITGLPVGTVVNVTEVGTARYTPSAAIIMNGGDPTTVTAGVGADLAIENQALGSRENSVAVTNTYDSSVPTGVILNVLPYVLMVAIAGGMIVLFTAMKRRKAQDNNED